MLIKSSSHLFRRENKYFFACFDTDKEVTLIGFDKYLVSVERIKYLTLNSEYEYVDVTIEPESEELNNFISILETLFFSSKLEYLEERNKEKDLSAYYKGCPFRDSLKDSIFSSLNKRKSRKIIPSLEEFYQDFYYTALVITSEETLIVFTFNNIKGIGSLTTYSDKGSLISVDKLSETDVDLCIEETLDSNVVLGKAFTLASKAEIKQLKNLFDLD